MNSNQKGKKGERELAAILKSYGYEDSRRGQQYCGSNGDADVVGLPGIHIECKRVEKLNTMMPWNNQRMMQELVKRRLSCIGRIEKSGWLLCHWMIG